MHQEAYEWVAKHAPRDAWRVLDIGGRNINGSVRTLFPANASYVVLDIRAGLGVDIVADAATWKPNRAYDVVLACEVFEHTLAWPDICATAYKACSPGGTFIITTAGSGRLPHSGVDGGLSLYPGEHYENIDPVALARTLQDVGWAGIVVDEQENPADVRAVCTRDEASPMVG